MVRLATKCLITSFEDNFKQKSKLMLDIFPDLITDNEELLGLILRGIEEGTTSEQNENFNKISALVFYELYDLIDDFDADIIEWWNSAKTKHLRGQQQWEKIIGQIDEDDESS